MKIGIIERENNVGIRGDILIVDRAGVIAGEEGENFGVESNGLIRIIGNLIGLSQTGARADNKFDLGRGKRKVEHKLVYQVYQVESLSSLSSSSSLSSRKFIKFIKISDPPVGGQVSDNNILA